MRRGRARLAHWLAGVGAGVNPARAIAPMILAGHFPDWWAYLAAPVAGSVAAVALCGPARARRRHARLASGWLSHPAAGQNRPGPAEAAQVNSG
jgi:Major intrinsic protein